mmetsp:Transcript_88239/g.222707  ORF Transcript_88239/g.222707 Transcript_88239/m.222707 type:complete len:203 (+) Transcript_88239:738-1346(+)
MCPGARRAVRFGNSLVPVVVGTNSLATVNAVGVKEGVTQVIKTSAGEHRPDNVRVQWRHLVGIFQLWRWSPQELISMGDFGTLEALHHPRLARWPHDVSLSTTVSAFALHRVLPTCPINHGVYHLGAILVVPKPTNSENIPIFRHERPEPVPELQKVRVDFHVVFGDDYQTIVRGFGYLANGCIVVVGTACRSPITLHVWLL